MPMLLLMPVAVATSRQGGGSAEARMHPPPLRQATAATENRSRYRLRGPSTSPGLWPGLHHAAVIVGVLADLRPRPIDVAGLVTGLRDTAVIVGVLAHRIVVAYRRPACRCFIPPPAPCCGWTGCFC